MTLPKLDIKEMVKMREALWHFEEELKNLLKRVKEENEKSGLKQNINKQTNKHLRSWHPTPLLHGK